MVVPWDTTCECEFWKLAPNGVSVHVERMNQPYEKDCERAAEYLMTAGVNVIVFACTSGSFFGGVEYEKELRRKLEEKTKLPVITAAQAMISALKTLNIKKVVVGTPYDGETNKRLKSFLEAYGFKILNMESVWHLEGTISEKYGRLELSWLTPEVSYRLAKKIFVPEADGVFISCCGLRTIEVIDALEKDLGKPVVSSVLASIWMSLRELKVKGKISGYGKLLEEYL
jgi:maleate isomerase